MRSFELEAVHDSTEGPLVLVVDDDRRNLTLACDVLRAAGFRTLEATTAADAVAVASAELPDVILLDLGLPDRDGTEVARDLGAASRTAAVPIVALTALRIDGADEWLREAGFAGYLEKPISVSDFPDQVRRYVSGG